MCPYPTVLLNGLGWVLLMKRTPVITRSWYETNDPVEGLEDWTWSFDFFGTIQHNDSPQQMEQVQ